MTHHGETVTCFAYHLPPIVHSVMHCVPCASHAVPLVNGYVRRQDIFQRYHNNHHNHNDSNTSNGSNTNANANTDNHSGHLPPQESCQSGDAAGAERSFKDSLEIDPEQALALPPLSVSSFSLSLSHLIVRLVRRPPRLAHSFELAMTAAAAAEADSDPALWSRLECEGCRDRQTTRATRTCFFATAASTAFARLEGGRSDSLARKRGTAKGERTKGYL